MGTIVNAAGTAVGPRSDQAGAMLKKRWGHGVNYCAYDCGASMGPCWDRAEPPGGHVVDHSPVVAYHVVYMFAPL